MGTSAQPLQQITAHNTEEVRQNCPFQQLYCAGMFISQQETVISDICPYISDIQ